MIVDADAFTRFEHAGWSRAAAGYHRFFSRVTGQVAEPGRLPGSYEELVAAR
jgi:hypothetical protein